MRLNRPLIAAAYAVALLMILLPLIEVVLSVWPMRFGQTAWRFGTLGLLSQGATTPLVGLIVLVTTAFLLGHRKTLLFTGVFAALAALLLIVAIPLFGLDAVQMRSQVRAQASRAFDISSMLATVKLAGLTVVLLLISVGAIKAARDKTRRNVTPETEPFLATRR
jgi:hypothetical protein